MAMISASQGTAKYKSGVQGGSTAYKNGVLAVTENPATKAIAQKDKMIANWNAAINGGKWEQKLGAVTLPMWKDAASNKGANNYAASADKASVNYQAWAADAYPQIAQLQQQIQAMPKVTISDSINRMIANVNGMIAISNG